MNIFIGNDILFVFK